MAIDSIGRARFAQQQQQKNFATGIKGAISEALKAKAEPEGDVLKLVVKQQEDERLVSTLSKLGQALAKVYAKIPAQVVLPKVFRINGTVSSAVTSMPPVKISNLQDLVPHLQSIENRIAQLATAVGMVAAQKPADIKVAAPALDPKPFVDALENVTIAVEGGGGSNEDMLGKLQEISEGITALYNRPQMTAAPVTHMSLNSLNGAYKATTLNVGTSATPLPTAALPNRRSLIVYNNSANTIYLGGPTVSTAGTGQGLPVPTGTYSPPFDSGPNMPLYGIAGSSSSVTVLETSDEASGR